MKRVYRVYKKTVSLVDETAAGMYQNLAGNKTGFLLESYDKSYDRFTVFGVNPEERTVFRNFVCRRQNTEKRGKPSGIAERILQ